MRFLLLTMLSVLVISCNDSGSSSKKNSTEPRQRDETRNTPPIEQAITEVNEVDLLDIAMDVPVEISGNKIIFKQAVSAGANGLNNNTVCSHNVAMNEEYGYTLAGSKLTIRNSSGDMVFTRVSGNNDSIVGSWSGEKREGNKHTMKRMTFLSENRLVVRTHCEG